MVHFGQAQVIGFKMASQNRDKQDGKQPFVYEAEQRAVYVFFFF